MAYSSGVFSRLYDWVTDKANGVKITASRMDAEFDGIATALSTCVLKDGTQTITANIPMSGFKLTGAGGVDFSLSNFFVRSDIGNGNPGVGFDSNDYLDFNRATNVMQAVVAGAVGWQIDAASRVSEPNKPFGSYYFGSVAASGGLASFTAMAQRGLYIAGGSNERVVVPAGGEYLIMWGFLSDGTANPATLHIRKNGVALGIDSYAGAAFGTGARSLIITLAANDYIELLNNSPGAVHFNTAFNSLNVIKVA